MVKEELTSEIYQAATENTSSMVQKMFSCKTATCTRIHLALFSKMYPVWNTHLALLKAGTGCMVTDLMYTEYLWGFISWLLISWVMYNKYLETENNMK